MQQSESLLREHNIKVTPQRLTIVSELYGRVHMSIDELYSAVKAKFPSISLATVYKNINAMMESDFIQEVKIPNQKSRYELAKDPHSHLICQECGRVDDLELDLDQITKEAVARSNYTISQNSLIFTGLCPHCRGLK